MRHISLFSGTRRVAADLKCNEDFLDLQRVSRQANAVPNAVGCTKLESPYRDLDFTIIDTDGYLVAPDSSCHRWYLNLLKYRQERHEWARRSEDDPPLRDLLSTLLYRLSGDGACEASR